jgi:hypothetical protein
MKAPPGSPAGRGISFFADVSGKTVLRRLMDVRIRFGHDGRVCCSIQFSNSDDNSCGDVIASQTPSFRDGPQDQTRNLEIPGSMLRIAPE